MAQGALHLGAATGDRIGIGRPAAALGLSVFTILSVVRWTGAGTANRCIYATPVNVVQLRTTGTVGNIELRVARATTTADYITSDTPFASSSWQFIAATFDIGAGTPGHIYHGTTPSGIIESTYGTTTAGSGAKTAESGTDPIWWGNRATAPAEPFLGDLAVGAVFSAAFTLQQIKSWCACPRLTVDANVAVEFGRAGKNGADWIDYAGNTGTVTGATQTDGTPLASGGAWSRQGRLFLKTA